MTPRPPLPIAVLLLLLALAGCPGPPPVVVKPTVACPACPACPRCPGCGPTGRPAGLSPASAPASQPASIKLPPRRGLFTRSAPFTSLDKLLDRHKLRHADAGRFRTAVAPYLGSRVRWRLRSWGGEVSTSGYGTPGGFLPTPSGPVQKGRIRLITTTLGASADLSTLTQAGHPVVACLARFPQGGDALFLRSDRRRERAPGRGEKTIEAVLWGVTNEGGPVLWLHDCAVVKPGP